MTATLAQPLSIGGLVIPGLVVQGLCLLGLLIVQTLLAWAVVSSLRLGDDNSHRLRRLSSHLIAAALLLALVAAMLTLPLDILLRDHSLNAALIFSAALLLPLLVLSRTWPLFALPLIGDDQTTRPRVLLRESWQLSGDGELFFTHGLPAALALLLASAGILLLTFRPQLLPIANTGLAALLLIVVVFPFAQLMVLTRGRRLLDLAAKTKRHRSRFGEWHADEQGTRRLPGGLRKAELDASLLDALRGGDVALAFEALDQGADANSIPEPQQRDLRGALALAVSLPDLRALRALIAAGADVNGRSGGITPLLAATRDSYEGRSEAVLTLLANGADPRETDDDGNTPLHHAARCVEPAVAAQLLDAGAEVDAINLDRHTALGVACANANERMVAFLLEHGAQAWLESAEPPLCLATSIAEDDPGVVKLLLKRKARIEATGSEGRTALIEACVAGHHRIVDALLAGGADADAVATDGSTPLMAAAEAGAVDILHALIKRKADLDRIDGDGRTALALACASPDAHEDSVRALIAAGAEHAHADHAGLRPVDHAAAAGRWHVVALLDPAYALPSNVSVTVDAMESSNAEHLADALRFEHWRVAAAYQGMIRDWSASARIELLRLMDTARQTAARDWLFNRGVDADATLSDGRSLAAQLIDQLPESLPLLRHILERGGAINGSGVVARLLAHAVSIEDNTDLLVFASQLIAQGADCHGRHAGQHAIHLAIACDDPHLVEQLLTCGVDPNTRNSVGRTPLHEAVELAGDAGLALVPVLLRAGAQPEIAAANGETALGLCLAQGRRELAMWLNWTRWSLPGRALRDSDLPAAAAAHDADAVSHLIRLGLAIETEDARGATALIRACGVGDVRAVAVLLDAGADFGHAASSGATPLSVAISARRESVVRLLLERGVDVGQRLPRGITALHVAAALGLPVVAALLLDAGAGPSVADATGTTALHAAARFGFASTDTASASALFEHLLQHGAITSQQDDQGSDALMLLLGSRAEPGTACDAQSLSLLTARLIEHGVALDQQDERGVSALHACAMHGLVGCARQLKARGAPLDLADGLGRSAGEIAAKLGYAELATELGANRHAIPGVRQMLRKRASD
ncbi:MAG: ankyrin repeat domain-containing protein [Dokdonella sp.]